jgi:hypothetical protein
MLFKKVYIRSLLLLSRYKVSELGAKMEKNYRSIVFVVLSLFFVSILAADVSATDIEIGDCIALQNIQSDLAANYVLTNDIDCSGVEFVPIGTSSSPFTGTFDGQNHKITGLYINKPSMDSIGLFSYTASGTIIKDVSLIDINIIGGGSSNYAGGLVGMSYGTITNSYTTGSIDCSGCGSGNTGGLVSINFGNIITSYTTVSVNGLNGVGGLAGINAGSGKITDSYATGSVYGAGSEIGGLVGMNYGDITNTYSTGSVSGPGWAYVGGLVGFSSWGAITNSYWDMQTSGKGASQGGTGKTTEEMMQRSTYVDWDFVNTWQTCGEINNGYPSLKFFGECPPCTPTTEICNGVDDDCDGDIDESAICGDGSSGNPYQITACTKLQYISNNLAANYILTKDIDCSDTVNWNSGAGFLPINYFMGIFDGQNYTINNLFINKSSDITGLFRQLRIGAIVENVGLINVNVTGTVFVGGLAGENLGTITNCYSTGSVSGSMGIGGLTGYNSGTITNSHATGSVTSSTHNAGGLVGENAGTITDSYATGSVMNSLHNAGGLVGINYDTIIDSYATGSVTGGDYLGGLVGLNAYFETIITNSHATGIVTGSDYLGGLVGSNAGTIIDSYATGSVIGNNAAIGGLVGGNDRGTITNSYAIGSVIGTTYVGGLVGYNAEGGSNIDKSHAIGSVTGTTYVGGLVGYDSAGTITNSYAIGSVTGTTYVGGAVGYFDFGNMITNIYATGNVTGSDYVGGLSGYMVYGIIINSYSTGSVTGLNSVGGLISFYTGGIIGSYWDINTSGQSTSAGGTGKTTAEMRTRSTFVSWDFVSAWVIDEGISYPYFLWQTPPLIDSDGDGYTYDVDCNDNDATINPGATEVCNNIDDDCDGAVDEDLTRQYGTTDVGECSYGTETCSSGLWSVTTSSVGPATEICNGLDDDCDGAVDEGVQITFYKDSDGDTFGDALTTTQACSVPIGYVSNSKDLCPLENSVGFDSNSDGCIDKLTNFPNVINNFSDKAIPKSIKKTFILEINAASNLIDKGRSKAAIGILKVFIIEVKVLRDKRISKEAADMLIAYANNVIAKING